MVTAVLLLSVAALFYGYPDALWRVWRWGVGVITTVRIKIAARYRWKQRHERCIDFISSLAAELDVGMPLNTALVKAAGSDPICPRAKKAAESSGDVPFALRVDADTEQLPALEELAVIWVVAHQTGAGLAAATERIVESQQQKERMRRQLASLMAGPRSTAKVLAVLPIIGMFLGSGIGAHPVAWLTGTWIGMVVGIGGLTLNVLGVVWIHRMVRRLENRL